MSPPIPVPDLGSHQELILVPQPYHPKHQYQMLQQRHRLRHPQVS
jgi:hypothetical protein